MQPIPIFKEHAGSTFSLPAPRRIARTEEVFKSKFFGPSRNLAFTTSQAFSYGWSTGPHSRGLLLRESSEENVALFDQFTAYFPQGYIVQQRALQWVLASFGECQAA